MSIFVTNLVRCLGINKTNQIRAFISTYVEKITFIRNNRYRLNPVLESAHYNSMRSSQFDSVTSFTREEEKTHSSSSCLFALIMRDLSDWHAWRAREHRDEKATSQSTNACDFRSININDVRHVWLSLLGLVLSVAFRSMQASIVVETRTTTEREGRDVLLSCRFERLNERDRVMW